MEEVQIMKKKCIVYGAIISVIILLCIRLFMWPNELGNIRTYAYGERITRTSTISLPGKINESIKIVYKLNAKAGEVDIVLYDSDGTIVYELDKAKSLETYFTFEKTDYYTLAAECTDFEGEGNIVVYEVN